MLIKLNSNGSNCLDLDQHDISFRGSVLILEGFPGSSVVKNPPANTRDASSIPGLRGFPGDGNGNPLQNSCLEKPMDRGVWWVTVYGVTQASDTTWWLNNNSSYFNYWDSLEQGMRMIRANWHFIGSITFRLCKQRTPHCLLCEDRPCPPLGLAMPLCWGLHLGQRWTDDYSFWQAPLFHTPWTPLAWLGRNASEGWPRWSCVVCGHP